MRSDTYEWQSDLIERIRRGILREVHGRGLITDRQFTEIMEQQRER